mgnify:CR=1 FL=1
MISPYLNKKMAIRADKLHEIAALSRANLTAFEPLEDGIDKKPALEIVNGSVAVIDISGVLVKRLSFLSHFLGEVSMPKIGQVFESALNDSQISLIVLKLDSPGGTVDGTEELAALIHASRGKKPIIAYSDGQICSAAYWIGSAADAIYVSGETIQVGSIGVAATHVDVSAQDAMCGEKYTEITAGKYKRITSAHRPLSDDGQAYLQEQVDYLYSVFVETVAQFRGRSIPQILEAADGKIFMGQAAVDTGLVDGIATFNQVLALAKSSEKLQAIKKNNHAAKTFEQHVFGLCAEGKSQQTAFQSIMDLHPELYADFNSRLKSGGTIGELFPGQNRNQLKGDC